MEFQQCSTLGNLNILPNVHRSIWNFVECAGVYVSEYIDFFFGYLSFSGKSSRTARSKTWPINASSLTSCSIFIGFFFMWCWNNNGKIVSYIHGNVVVVQMHSYVYKCEAEILFSVLMRYGLAQIHWTIFFLCAFCSDHKVYKW